MKKNHIVQKIIIATVLLFIIAGIWYVNDYYHSDNSVETYLKDSDSVKVAQIIDGYFFDGAGTKDAIIFYPGAKVEYTAYAPLLFHLAEEGVDCFLVKMPCNLAILGQSKADGIQKEYSYEHWYLAGHSLGGAMAADYIAKHSDTYDGLILLAAYGTKDISDTDLAVLSIYGSKDGVLNREKYASARKNMPQSYTELVIAGGNHGNFGCYGQQKGDGAAKISGEEQLEQTKTAILTLIQQE